MSRTLYTIFLVCFIFLLLRGSIDGAITEQPSDTSVIQGEIATLKCTVVNTKNAVLSWLYWSKGNKHLSINETILPDMGADVKARYFISGNRTIGEYYLKILNVQKKDEGYYHCSYISNTGGETSAPAALTVLVPPEKGYPKCNVHANSDVGSDISTIWPGQGVVFSCFSRGGDPAAQLSWHRGNHSILDARPSRITYERILKPEDNGIKFTCDAKSPALIAARSCFVMPMMILPVVQVRPMSGQIKHGQNGTFYCEGSAIPRVHKYTWFAFNSEKPVENVERFTLTNQNRVLTIHDVNYSENKMEIRCEISTESGLKSSASIRLDVAEPPKPKIVTKKPVEIKTDHEDNDNGNITDIRKIISMDVNFVVAIIAGSLVLLLLLVTIIMGCWVCGTTKPRRPNMTPRIDYTETVPTTIPQSYSMDGLNQCQNYVLYGDTSCAVNVGLNKALDNENAPGYISALYATLDKNKRPVRTSVAVNIPGKPVAQITPTQSGDSFLTSDPSCYVKPEKTIPEPVKLSPLVGKVTSAVLLTKSDVNSGSAEKLASTSAAEDTTELDEEQTTSSDDGTDVDCVSNTKKP